MSKVERVLIVGGGLAGLALAIALRQRRLSAAIVERASDWSVPGAGLYLVGCATRALRALGIADDAARDGCVIRTQTLFNHRGTRVAEIDAEASGKDAGHASGSPAAICVTCAPQILDLLCSDRLNASGISYGMIGA
jgi:2-polyprenyl-6-methoxyphenol hydroxylase-like FAD-dependent oxidoreductase